MVKNNTIWTYWETTKKYPFVPDYISLCFETYKKHGNNLIVLNPDNIKDYFPDLNLTLIKDLRPAHKADYIRFFIIKNFGGCWVDADSICFKNFDPIFEMTSKYDFISYSRFIRRNNIGVNDETIKPSLGFMCGVKNNEICNNMLKEAEIKIKELNGKKAEWTFIGYDIMWPLIKTIDRSRYYQFGRWNFSTVSARHSFLFFSKIEDIKKHIRDETYAIMLYNSNFSQMTKPGIPTNFLSMKKENILKKDWLISKMFNLSLN